MLFSGQDNFRPIYDHKVHRTYDRNYMNYPSVYPQHAEPSKTFTEDVLKIVNQVIDDLKANLHDPSSHKNEPGSYINQASSQPNEELVSKIKQVEKDIKDTDKALYSLNSDLTKRLDNLTQIYNSLKDVSEELQLPIFVIYNKSAVF